MVFEMPSEGQRRALRVSAMRTTAGVLVFFLLWTNIQVRHYVGAAVWVALVPAALSIVLARRGAMLRSYLTNGVTSIVALAAVSTLSLAAGREGLLSSVRNEWWLIALIGGGGLVPLALVLLGQRIGSRAASDGLVMVALGGGVFGLALLLGLPLDDGGWTGVGVIIAGALVAGLMLGLGTTHRDVAGMRAGSAALGAALVGGTAAASGGYLDSPPFDIFVQYLVFVLVLTAPAAMMVAVTMSRLRRRPFAGRGATDEP